MNTLKVIILIASLSGLLMIVGYFIARRTGVVIALIVSLIMNFGSYWYSDTIVLSMYNAQPVTKSQAPVLYDAVEAYRPKRRYLFRKSMSFAKTHPMHSQRAGMKIMRLLPLQRVS